MVRKNCVYWVCITGLLFFSGCTNLPQNTSSSDIKSVAHGQLQSDVMRMIGTYEAAMGKSNHPTLRSVESVGVDQKDGVVKRVKERWIVSSDGEDVPYLVQFIPTPATGGTDFSVAREKL